MTPPDPSTLEAAAESALRAAVRGGLPEVDARDLAQEALLRALTSAPPPDGVPLPAWTYGIARNLCRDHIKSAQRREVPAEMVDTPATDEDLATVLTVRHAIDELPEPLRDVIALHELEEHTLADTARVLQIPFDTAKDRLRRAREQLRAKLADSDAACAHERSHSRRRAAAQGAAIVTAVYASIGQRALAAGLGASLGVSAGATTAVATTTTVATAATGPTTAILAKTTTAFAVRGWIAGVIGTVTLAGGFVVGRTTAPEPASVPMTSTAPREGIESAMPRSTVTSTEPPAPIAPAAPVAPRPAQGAPSTGSPSRVQESPVVATTSAVPAPTDPTLDPAQRERLLLDRGRVGIQRGLPDEALVALMSHERQFPAGKLGEERDVLMIEAYVRAGQLEIARKRIAAYIAAYPRGVLRARVDAFAAQLAVAPN